MCVSEQMSKSHFMLCVEGMCYLFLYIFLVKQHVCLQQYQMYKAVILLFWSYFTCSIWQRHWRTTSVLMRWELTKKQMSKIRQTKAWRTDVNRIHKKSVRNTRFKSNLCPATVWGQCDRKWSAGRGKSISDNLMGEEELTANSTSAVCMCYVGLWVCTTKREWEWERERQGEIHTETHLNWMWYK